MPCAKQWVRLVAEEQAVLVGPLAVVCGAEQVGHVSTAPRHPRLARLHRLYAGSIAAPPVVEPLIDAVQTCSSALVQQSAQPAPELCVDVLADAVPPEVRVVAVAVGGDGAQEVGEFARRLEVVDVDERLGRCGTLVVDARCSHHHRHHVVPETTHVDTQILDDDAPCLDGLRLLTFISYCLLS